MDTHLKSFPEVLSQAAIIRSQVCCLSKAGPESTREEGVGVSGYCRLEVSARSLVWQTLEQHRISGFAQKGDVAFCPGSCNAARLRVPAGRCALLGHSRHHFFLSRNVESKLFRATANTTGLHTTGICQKWTLITVKEQFKT